MLNRFNNILVLAPHTDDGELGAGGTIARFIAEGSHVDYVAFSACEESVPEGFDQDILRYEVINATSKLGIKPEHVKVLDFKVRHFPSARQEILEEMVKLRKNVVYDLVLIPSTQDIHQDHMTIANEAIRAFKGTNIWGYELNWNQLTTSNSGFVSLSLDNVEAKVNSIKMYESQFGRGYCRRDYILSLAKVRGAQVSCDYAESFEIIRTIYR